MTDRESAEPAQLDKLTGTDVYVGNAADDGASHRGWFVGQFIPAAAGGRSTGDLEVKWGVHPAGEERSSWSPGDHTTTLVLLVQGRFKISLPRTEVLFSRPGDYAVWGPGTAHHWAAVDDSVVLTVRWPSRSVER